MKKGALNLLLLDGSIARNGGRYNGDSIIYTTCTNAEPAAIVGFTPWSCQQIGNSKHWMAHDRGKPTTEAQVKERIRLAREPWREYCEWRPDDMPRKGGNPAALARLLAECGDKGEPEELQAAA